MREGTVVFMRMILGQKHKWDPWPSPMIAIGVMDWIGARVSDLRTPT